ncbi:unnamed protein product [[Candida] boidinii]|uniref:Unnamed protein product n=1 Tax=Candida boidinii TaxID=5477 RepID=A0ACB5U212_CANBO|nr:unnamed protein product [[Candida] boidinii]
MTNQIEELKINEQVINLKLKKQLNTLDKIDDDDHDIDHDHNTNDKDIEGKTTEILDLNETDKSNLKLNTSKNLEIDILKKDIDSYKSRINNLELRNENLIKELTISKSNIEINKINNENNDKIKILENDNLILLGRLNNERKNFDNLIKKNNKKFENFKIEINSLNNEIKHLKKRYNDTIDYDEIKKELEIIKEIEFGELNINDNDEDTNNNNKKKIIKKLSSSSRSSTPIQDDDVDGDNYKDGQDDNDDDDDENDDNENNDENSEEDSLIEVESTLLMKNKKLTNELISLKNKNEELNKKLSNLELEINSKNNEINDLQLLNNQLENDLIDLNNNSQIRKNINDGTIAGSIINGGGANDDNWDTMSMISSVAGTVKTSRNSFNGSMSSSSSRLSPVSSIIGFDPSINSQQQQQQQQLNQQDSSILPIITQQRDRFRLRNKELEDDSKKQFGKIVELKREINSLKTDNRELYERIRFLQYNKDQNQKQNNGNKKN